MSGMREDEVDGFEDRVDKVATRLKTEDIKQELIDCLHETRQTLALVVFFSLENHPDQEMVADIRRVLARSRKCLDDAKQEG